jgi:hypothetical protein
LLGKNNRVSLLRLATQCCAPAFSKADGPAGGQPCEAVCRAEDVWEHLRQSETTCFRSCVGLVSDVGGAIFVDGARLCSSWLASRRQIKRPRHLKVTGPEFNFAGGWGPTCVLPAKLSGMDIRSRSRLASQRLRFYGACLLISGRVVEFLNAILKI